MTTFYSILHPQYTFQRPTFVDVDGEQVPKHIGEEMTYCRKIRIPIIQRDYAEGRPNTANKRKITNFLKQMLDVIYGTKQTTSLDFIYGYVQDESGEKCNMQEWEEVNDIRFAFEPLDGQQRLNAIFSFITDGYELPMDADDVDGEKVAGKKWSELSSMLQIQFFNQSIDVVHLIGYTDEEIDETFLRLQNGTPLKAAEKRRAIAGNMRNVVSELAKHDIFKNYCSFANQQSSERYRQVPYGHRGY